MSVLDIIRRLSVARSLIIIACTMYMVMLVMPPVNHAVSSCKLDYYEEVVFMIWMVTYDSWFYKIVLYVIFNVILIASWTLIMCD